MTTLIRCDRCKKEYHPAIIRSIKIPLYWNNSTDIENEFDIRIVDLCFDCGQSLVKWFENKNA